MDSLSAVCLLRSPVSQIALALRNRATPVVVSASRYHQVIFAALFKFVKAFDAMRGTLRGARMAHARVYTTKCAYGKRGRGTHYKVCRVCGKGQYVLRRSSDPQAYTV